MSIFLLHKMPGGPFFSGPWEAHKRQFVRRLPCLTGSPLKPTKAADKEKPGSCDPLRMKTRRLAGFLHRGGILSQHSLWDCSVHPGQTGVGNGVVA